jgi:hypothetical protein
VTVIKIHIVWPLRRELLTKIPRHNKRRRRRRRKKKKKKKKKKKV